MGFVWATKSAGPFSLLLELHSTTQILTTHAHSPLLIYARKPYSTSMSIFEDWAGKSLNLTNSFPLLLLDFWIFLAHLALFNKRK